MEFAEGGGEVEGEVVADEAEEGMFAFLEQILDVSKTADVVSIQIGQHLVSTEFDSFEHPPFLGPGEVDSQQGQVHVVGSFGEYPYNFVELGGKDHLVDFGIVHL